MNELDGEKEESLQLKEQEALLSDSATEDAKLLKELISKLVTQEVILLTERLNF